MYVVVRSSLCV